MASKTFLAEQEGHDPLLATGDGGGGATGVTLGHSLFSFSSLDFLCNIGVCENALVGRPRNLRSWRGWSASVYHQLVRYLLLLLLLLLLMHCAFFVGAGAKREEHVVFFVVCCLSVPVVTIVVKGCAVIDVCVL